MHTLKERNKKVYLGRDIEYINKLEISLYFVCVMCNLSLVCHRYVRVNGDFLYFKIVRKMKHTFLYHPLMLSY